MPGRPRAVPDYSGAYSAQRDATVDHEHLASAVPRGDEADAGIRNIFGHADPPERGHLGDRRSERVPVLGPRRVDEPRRYRMNADFRSEHIGEKRREVV